MADVLVQNAKGRYVFVGGKSDKEALSNAKAKVERWGEPSRVVDEKADDYEAGVKSATGQQEG